ncbi:hypothetical protein TWF730_008033 [Orbilia blumenaviensis]|uniref:F-box domain-containing protein n=1 Tax=Orbilia blumenaviensis TaxID=1796055 RepID=A0AAV9V9K7_9PEZI
MHILRLPVELQHDILFHLSWHEHFIASQVCQRWASILKMERFRRKRYVYDKIEADKSREGYPPRWYFQRYLPHETGPPWRNAHVGGELSLHGLLWSEVLIMFLRREKGEVKIRLLITADAVGYITEPSGLGLLKQLHEKRYGPRSIYDITNSPLLDHDKLFFWGKKPGFGPDASESESADSSAMGVGVPPPFISKKLPKDPPVVLFRSPARAHVLKREKQGRYTGTAGDPKSLPLSEQKDWTLDDFWEDQEIGAEPLHYPGSNGDSTRVFLNRIGKYLTDHLFEDEDSTLAVWCIFDSEQKYLCRPDHQSNTLSHRDPRRNIWVPTTILRNGEKQSRAPKPACIDYSTRTRTSRT